MSFVQRNMCRRCWLGLILSLLLVFMASPTLSAEAPPGQPYTLQIEDSLAKLADKYYQDLAAWPAILVATRAKAGESHDYARIYDPKRLQPGQILWVPDPDQVDDLLTRHEARPKLQPVTEEMLAGWDNYIETKRVRYGIPGAAVVMVRGNEVIFAKGFGVREVGQPDPVTPDTIFPIGSTTKSLNATLAARLVDQGLLAWDQPVVEIWPGFALSDLAHTRQLRFRHLLNMGSGIPRRDLVWSGAGLTPEELLDTLVDLPIWDPIGTHYYYNNQMVAAGGYIAALAAGGEYGRLHQAYTDRLQTQVFEPLGMRSAATDLNVVLANPNRAIPHDLDLYGNVVPTPYHEDLSILPAGGVYANALDMGKFLLLHLNEGVTAGGTRLVSAENIRETHRPQTRISDTLSYGMGWFVEDFRGVDIIWHDGDVFGVKAMIAFIPEADVGLVVLSNRIIGLPFNWGVVHRWVELMYDLSPKAEQIYDDIWTGFQTNSATILAGGVSPTVDPAAVAPYLGLYEDGWRVELRGDRLYAIRGPYEWQLLQAPGGHFVVNNGYGIGMTLYLEPDRVTGQPAMKFTLSTGEPGVYEKVEDN